MTRAGMSEATPKSLQHMLWEVWFPVHLERCRGFDSTHLILFIMVVFFSSMYFKNRHNMHDDDVSNTAGKRHECSDERLTSDTNHISVCVSGSNTLL
jgi:hypothetical protein